MIELVVTLAVLGLIVWAITTLVLMPAWMVKLIYVIVIICIVVYLLQAFGLWHFHDVDVPNLGRN